MTDPENRRPAASARPAAQAAPKKRSLISLVGDLPSLVSELVHREIDLIKTEMIGKLKALGIGGALFAVAAVILLFMIGVLLTAAILGLAQVMPGWLAALLVALLLLIVAAIVALIGWRKMKSGIPPVPTESIDSLQSDLKAVKGTGRFQRGGAKTEARAAAAENETRGVR